MTKVLLTGASGFVAIHTLEALLTRGFVVKATVRSQEKGHYLLNKFPGKPLEIAIVEDIQAPNAFENALKDSAITAVIHTASPFFAAKNDPLKELLDPAVKGTKNVLQAIKTFAPQVSTVVVTSSYAAISNVTKRTDHSFVHTEATWSEITWEQAISDLNLSYRASKKFAERALWDFVAEEKPNFTATTVNPPLVYGPVIQDVTSPEKLNTSNAILWKNVIESTPGDTSDSYANDAALWVDVRDVALAHVLPLEKPELAGKRLFVTPGFCSTQSILDVLNEKFPALKGKIAVGRPGTGDKQLPELYQYDNHVTNDLLGIKYHTLEESMIDTFKSLVNLRPKSFL
ncbi:uncharacterized protein SAPINGB_P004129 [Magnusiomyces paraingens]|uniref:NAD-dependent epimerase/dehydratase domain-containing protein n=1 Tax=Magnusiomyces paraingens TaxID=2606893 RepID=A0A5E8C0B9_9ASCO|nr:uncharacterized protein SAPINGB_P004129 [Saprochaete ingens]VVT54545.1 unnamed protein product [Saprochaete ingens]